jgi:hypothetical protein
VDVLTRDAKTGAAVGAPVAVAMGASYKNVRNMVVVTTGKILCTVYGDEGWDGTWDTAHEHVATIYPATGALQILGQIPFQYQRWSDPVCAYNPFARRRYTLCSDISGVWHILTVHAATGTFVGGQPLLGGTVVDAPRALICVPP